LLLSKNRASTTLGDGGRPDVCVTVGIDGKYDTLGFLVVREVLVLSLHVPHNARLAVEAPQSTAERIGTADTPRVCGGRGASSNAPQRIDVRFDAPGNSTWFGQGAHADRHEYVGPQRQSSGRPGSIVPANRSTKAKTMETMILIVPRRNQIELGIEAAARELRTQ
jgi:hypothetical protein